MSNRFELDGAARNMPLFSGTAMCARCRDHGVWLTPQSRVELCPRIQCGDEHPELSAGARLIERAKELREKLDAMNHKTLDGNQVKQLLGEYIEALESEEGKK